MLGSGLIQIWMVGSGELHVQSRNGSVVVDWFTCGSRLVHIWFACGSLLVHMWFSSGSVLVHVWFSVGSHVVHYRFTCGSVLVQLCCRFVVGLDQVMLIGSHVVQH